MSSLGSRSLGLSMSPPVVAPPSSLCLGNTLLGEEEGFSLLEIVPSKENIAASDLRLGKVVKFLPARPLGGPETPATVLSQQFKGVSRELIRTIEECAKALSEMSVVWERAGWKRCILDISSQLEQIKNFAPFEKLIIVVGHCHAAYQSLVDELYTPVEPFDPIKDESLRRPPYEAGLISYKVKVVSQFATVSSHQRQWANEMRTLAETAQSLDRWLPDAGEYLKKYHLWKSVQTALALSQRACDGFILLSRNIGSLSPEERLEQCSVLDFCLDVFKEQQPLLSRQFPFQTTEGMNLTTRMADRIKSIQSVAEQELEAARAAQLTESASVSVASANPLSLWEKFWNGVWKAFCCLCGWLNNREEA